MPHDRYSNLLVEGDKVVFYGFVKTVYVGEDYCNVNIELDVPMQPSGTPYSITLNTKQVALVPK